MLPRRTAVGVLWCAIALLGATVRPGAQDTVRVYAIVDLGTLGGVSSEGSGINAFGDVVGWSLTPGGAPHAFMYRNGQLSDLGTLIGGTSSYATAISDRGTVIGYGGINAYGPMFSEVTQGFTWQDGVMRSLNALYCPCTFNVRYGTSRALAVNNDDVMVGDSIVPERSLTHAFVSRAGAMQDLGARPEGPSTSTAFGINDLGEIVGAVDGRAFLMRGGVLQDLGIAPGFVRSEARAVNAKGQVAGVSFTSAGTPAAFLWDLGTMRTLNGLSGDAATEARAININSDAVGRSGNADLSASRAVVWQNGVAVDLTSRLLEREWQLTVASAINNAGQIAGAGYHDGQLRAFLLTPR
jgi:probable HAF family extracellular repeat protein